jgi:site-specific DNA-cytosine methylase
MAAITKHDATPQVSPGKANGTDRQVPSSNGLLSAHETSNAITVEPSQAPITNALLTPSPTNSAAVANIRSGNWHSEARDPWAAFWVPAARLADSLNIVTPASRQVKCFTKTYTQYSRGSGSVLATNNCDELQNNGTPIDPASLRLRYFTPREVANFHSFPPDFCFPLHVTLRQRYALLGNSLSVRVVADLLRYLLHDELDSS